MDPEAVGGEEGLAAAFLITDKGVLSSVSLLVGAQVACCAVGAGTALKGALVPLYLAERGQLSKWIKDLPRVWLPGYVDTKTQKKASNKVGIPSR